MIKNTEIIIQKRLKLIKNILNQQKLKKFFNKTDILMMSKYFDNAYDLSLIENIYHINSADLCSKDIDDVLYNFKYTVKDNTILKTRNLYELTKLSTLPEKKLRKHISDDGYKDISSLLEKVLNETNFISFDFLILRITDNFATKNQNSEIVTIYNALKKSILDKMVHFDYKHEKREKETTYLCWTDRLLNAVINNEISPDEFIKLSAKILNLTNNTIYLYRKILNSADYLLTFAEHSSNTELKQYKTFLENEIREKYTNAKISPAELEQLVISKLAKQIVNQEDFYYLFDMTAATAKISEENKKYCFNLCLYLLHHNTKRNIFNYRFVRKYFFDTILSMISDKDSFELKQQEIHLLLILLYTDVFFCFVKQKIIKQIISILATMNRSCYKLNHYNFYRYFEILDYIFFRTPDLIYPSLINYVSANNNNRKNITDKFILTKIF